MNLKQIIKRKKIAEQLESGTGYDVELTLPAEPLIYSVKYPVGSRRRPLQYFRNRQWTSTIKCFFKDYQLTSTPVVVLVRFFVSPPSHIRVKKADLKKENVPAVFAYELLDYTLSFLEMLHHVLINSYKQIVKMEMDKFYSDNPRIVFKFMKWDHYVNLYHNNTFHPETQGLGKNRQVRKLQPEPANHDDDKNLRAQGGGEAGTHPIQGSPPGDSAL